MRVSRNEIQMRETFFCKGDCFFIAVNAHAVCRLHRRQKIASRLGDGIRVRRIERRVRFQQDGSVQQVVVQLAHGRAQIPRDAAAGLRVDKADSPHDDPKQGDDDKAVGCFP